MGWGGQEIRILTEAQGMLARGHQVQIWAAPDSTILAEAAVRGLPHLSLPIGRKMMAGLLALRRAIREARPDVINTHSSTDTWLAALAMLGLRAPPPIVRTRHISAPVPRNLASRWLYQRASRHIVTTGDRLRASLIQHNGFDARRITSVPTGIDSALYHPGDKANARRALGLESTARYIGIVATLRSWKGHLYLLDAFARLVHEDPGLRLAIVGDGPMQDVIVGRIKALALTDKVVLAGRRKDVPVWLWALDVFCLPSYANEGVPQALVQAMLTGLPVVTTAVGSITEAVSDGRTGRIVAERNVEQLVAALRQLLHDRALADKLGQQARAWALQQFELTTMLTRMEDIFQRVIQNGSGQ